MEFTCTYKSGKEYGPAKRSSDYIATVAKTLGGVKIGYEFNEPVPSKLQPGDPKASVTKLELILSDREAAELAAVLMAQANHPVCRDSAATWMPVDAMPSVERRHWARKLHVTEGSGRSGLYIENKTAFHVGVISIEVNFECELKEGPKNLEQTLFLSVDLSPGSRLQYDLLGGSRKLKLPMKAKFTKLTSWKVVEVTGLKRGNYGLNCGF